MKAENIQDIYELSPAQQGILFHSLYSPNSGVYFVQRCYTLRGLFNVAAFENAWQQVVARHTALRTSFYWENLDKPIQVVHKQVRVPLEQQDWRGIDTAEQQEQLEAFLESDRASGFDLSQAPLIRLTLIHLTDKAYQFVWSKHHLILDGWSTALVLKEVVELYEALCQGQDLPWAPSTSYGDYITWLQQQDLSKAEVFWRQTLSGIQAPTPLISLDVDHSPSREEKYDEQLLKLSAATTAALQSLARKYQLTLNTLIQGAWAMLLSRYSGEDDVVYGNTVSGRPADLVGAESMVGLFINTLPMRVKADAEQSLVVWLRQLQTQLVEMRQYEYSPLVEVQGWSEVPRGVPLFESIVVFENYPVDRSLREWKDNLEIQDVSFFDNTNYPLTVTALPSSEFELRISYDCRRFDAATITRMLGHFRTLLEGIVANPEQHPSDLLILTEAEQQQLLVEWNNPQADYPNNQCIHQLFEDRMEQMPDAIAVVFEDQQLTYRELNARANQLAHHLRSLGVGPEVLVGICVERSLEMVVGLLGILKAGGAYVPLDPAYPQERLAFMLEDAQVPVLLTQARLMETLPPHQAQVICLDTDWDAIASGQPQSNPISKMTGNNLAYVIYTSGSTGRPKGAMNTHQGLCNRLLWMQDAYQLTETDCVLQKTPFSFDVSVWEFFWPLLNGARLVVAQPGGHQDSAYLVKLIADQQITTLHFVPSMLRVFLEEPGLEACSCLRRVICSGEALPSELQKRFFARLDAELHNLYGPTEAAIDVTFWHCQRQNDFPIVPIGRPIANTQIYILDQHLQPVPIGVPGELHIGGVGLARGYLNQSELTNEKFIPNPFASVRHEEEFHLSPLTSRLSPSNRLYKTGDLARYLPDGNIEFLGRIDHQVKIRGFRIELGEIEALLGQHPAVGQSVVIAWEDLPSNKRLVAYLVPTHKQTPSISNLRSFLRTKLPEYMVPSAFVILEALPLTPNGKVNRGKLLAPDPVQPEVTENFVAPRTNVEQAIAEIWAEVLTLEQVGIHDNFFDLGGHSLLATLVISRLRREFQVELPLRYLFESPTVAGLAVMIVQRLAEQADSEMLDQMLAALEQLPEEEIQAVLAKQGGNQ